MIRDLWAAAIVVRGLSLVIGISRRAPASWIVWAAWAESTDLLLRYFDYAHMGGPRGPYVITWIAQQLVGLLLLAAVTDQIAKPTRLLACLSTALAFLASATLHVPRRWEDSPVEMIVEACGFVAMALGLMSAASLFSRFRSALAVLTLFLLAQSLLMLAAPDYLTSAGIGRAWSMLDIAAFAAWGILYGRKSA